MVKICSMQKSAGGADLPPSFIDSVLKNFTNQSSFSPKSFIKLFESSVFAMGRSSYTKHEYFLFGAKATFTVVFGK